MEVRQLRYFLAVADERNFTRAAARLHISQQSLSAAVKQLELQIGCRLIDRTTQRMELTPAGRALARAGPGAMLAMREAEHAARRAAEPGPVRVRYGPDAEHLVRALLAQLPGDVPIRAWSGADVDIMRALSAGEADAVFCWSLDGHDGVQARAVSEETAVLLVPVEHPFALAGTAPAEAVRAEPLLLFPRDAAPVVWDRLRDLLGGRHVVELATAGHAAVTHAVLCNTGVAPITAGTVDDHRRPGLTTVPIEPPPRFALHLAWRVGSTPPFPTLRTTSSSRTWD